MPSSPILLFGPQKWGAFFPLYVASQSWSFTSIAIGSDGFPIISYRDASSRLAAAHCTAVDCSAATHTALDGTGTGAWSSIATGADGGLPIISYYTSTGPSLSMVHCDVLDCSASISSGIAGTMGAGQLGTSVTVGTDGLAIISYSGGNGSSNLSVFSCPTQRCVGGSYPVVVDSTAGAGGYSSITIGADGLPIISYQGMVSGNTNLSVVHCANTRCSPPYVRRR